VDRPVTNTTTGELTGKTALITGAARGVGRAIAENLAGLGAHVALLDRCTDHTTTPYASASRSDLDTALEVIRSAGADAIAIEVDVGDADGMRRATEQTIATFGRIDIVVVNAGIFTWGKLWELSEEQWDETIDTNLKGAWLTLRAALPPMIEQRSGRIIAIASTAGLRGGEEIGHYVASKFGLVGMIQSLALEVGGYGITANAVCPSRMRTPMVTFDAYYERWAGEGGTEGSMADATRREHVLPVDFLPVSAVVDTVAWLAASEAAAYITGVALPVDAGSLLR
jgi:NAD(P)-dependent dehydrogenase (short-subunit alcohol dehydrogenase family)